MKNHKLNKRPLFMLAVLLGIAGVSPTNTLLAEKRSKEEKKMKKKAKKENKEKNKQEKKKQDKEVNKELQSLKQQKKMLKKKLKKMKKKSEDKDKQTIAIPINSFQTLKHAQKSLKYKKSDKAFEKIKELAFIKNTIKNLRHKQDYINLKAKIEHMTAEENNEKAEEFKNAYLDLVRLRTMKNSILYHIRHAPLLLNNEQLTLGNEYTSNDIKTMIKIGLKKTPFEPAEIIMNNQKEMSIINKDELLSIDENEGSMASLATQIRKELKPNDKEDITFKHALTFVKKDLNPKIKKLVSSYVSRRAAHSIDTAENESKKENEFKEIEQERSK